MISELEIWLKTAFLLFLGNYFVQNGLPFVLKWPSNGLPFVLNGLPTAFQILKVKIFLSWKFFKLRKFSNLKLRKAVGRPFRTIGRPPEGRLRTKGRPFRTKELPKNKRKAVYS